jgi:hypothetical protein
MGHFLEDPTIAAIKVLAILYVTVIYGVAGLATGYGLDKYVFNSLYENEEEEMKKPYLRQGLEIIIITGIYGVVCYIGRNLLQEIPFPLHNRVGFDYMKVNEVKSGVLYGVFTLITLTCLANKVTAFKKTIA